MYELLVYLSCCLIMVAAAIEPMDTNTFPEEIFPELEEMPELGEPSPQEQEVMTAQKINWLPVWEEQDVDVVRERKARSVQEEELTTTDQVELESTTSADILRTGKTCPGTPERGLARLLREARPLLPTERLRNIMANAKEDTQVRDLLQLLRSDGFKQLVANLRATKPEQTLQEFVCQRLKINHDYYLDYFKVLFNIYTNEKPSSPLPNRRKGVRGLLIDLRDALPRLQLRDLYLRLSASDRELAESIRLIRGREFRRLLRDVRALEEYRVIRTELEKAGVPLQQLMQLVASALGMGNVDMGGEILVVNL